MEPVQVPLLGGVNLESDPTKLAPGEAVRLENMWPRKPGVLETRPGMYCEPTPLPDAAGTHRYWGGQAHEAWGEVGDIIFSNAFKSALWTAHMRGNHEYASADPANGGAAAVYNAFLHQEWIAIHDGNKILTKYNLGEVRGRVCMFEYRGLIICLTGKAAHRLGDAVLTGNITVASVTTLGGAEMEFEGPGAIGSPTEPFEPSVGCVWNDRVVYASASSLYFADKGDPTTIGGNWVIGDGSENITAVFEVALSNTTDGTRSALVVCTRNTAWLVTEAPQETFDPTTPAVGLAAAKIMRDAGCVSHASVASSKHGTLWCGPDDVWFMAVGGLPERVGTKIRPRITAMNAQDQLRIHAGFNGDAYVLALDGENGVFQAGGVNSNRGNQTGSRPCGEHWWLDLRNGPTPAPQATWFGPQIYRGPGMWAVSGAIDNSGAGTTCLRSRRASNAQYKLFSLMPAWCLPDQLNTNLVRIVGMNLVGFDGPEALDCVFPRAGGNTPIRSPDTEYTALDDVAYNPASSPQVYVWAGEYLWKAITSGASHTSLNTENRAQMEPKLDSAGIDTHEHFDGDVTWRAWAYMDVANPGPADQLAPFIAHVSNGRLIEAAVIPKWISPQIMPDGVQDRLVDRIELAYELSTPQRGNYIIWPHSEVLAENLATPVRTMLTGPFRNTLDSALLGTAGAEVRRVQKQYFPPVSSRRQADARYTQWQIALQHAQDNATVPSQFYAPGSIPSETAMWLYIDETNDTVMTVMRLLSAALSVNDFSVQRLTLTHGWRTLEQVLGEIQTGRNTLADDIAVLDPGANATISNWASIGDLAGAGYLRDANAYGGIQRLSNQLLMDTIGDYEIALFCTGWIPDTCFDSDLTSVPAWQTYKAIHRKLMGQLGFNSDVFDMWQARYDDMLGFPLEEDFIASSAPTSWAATTLAVHSHNLFFKQFKRRTP